MPELPEVETIRRGLEGELIGAVFSGVEVLTDKSVADDYETIGEQLLDREITGLRRKGKILIIDLDQSLSILIHLKMTGQVILEKSEGARKGGGHPTASMQNELPDKSTRAVFTFRDGSQLFFNDQRKFGWIKLKEQGDIKDESLIARMGPEPLDEQFTPDYLQNKTQQRKSSIKAVLLDQSTVAGLGNIYVDESLHLAKIHPERVASDLTPHEVHALHGAVVEIITNAIRYEGTAFRNFMNHWGERGNYFDHARVFNRSGLPCPVCGEEIMKIRVVGRGTHICNRCQVLAPAPDVDTP